MLSTIVNIYNTMPSYSFWLIWWALPSLCIALFLLQMYKEELKRPRTPRYEGFVAIILFLSIVWPTFFFFGAAAFLIETIHWLETFTKWTRKQRTRYQMKKKLKQQPKAIKHIQLMHRVYRHGTLCGVASSSETRKIITPSKVTCPICLFIMRRDGNGQ